MPATKPYRFAEWKKTAQSIIAKYIPNKGDEDKAAVMIRRTKRCLQDKRRNPETFTLGEMLAFCDSVHMTGPDRAMILGAKDVTQVFTGQ